ncbi:MAG: IclR family transcriptional regulator [Mycobacteriales bacterium]|nr:MAG: IclR family transcriptional regulator [Pseudonocardiales bacterium]
MAGQEATTLRRGIELLVRLGSDEAVRSGGLGVVALADTIGQDKSQVSRTLKTLAQAGLVDRSPDTQAYRLGWLIYQLAARTGDHRLLTVAPPVLTPMVHDLGERMHLSVLRGREVLTVWTESPSETVVQVAGWVGRTVPAWCTSSGRALLIDHDAAMLAALLRGVDFTDGGPRSPRTIGELARRVSAAAAAGHAVVEDEFESGLVGVAAPIRDHSGRVAAAVNMSGPQFRLGGRIDEAAAAVRTAADQVSRLLAGGSIGPHGIDPEESVR